MTVNDWLSLIGSLGLIGTGSLIGSLITIVVGHFLEKRKLKTERQSHLQREIYFKLQEQAEKIFEDINLIRRQIEEIRFWLEKGNFDPKITKTSIVERISKISSIPVYFSKEIVQKYNEISLGFRQIVSIYFEFGKIGDLPQETVDNLNKLLSDFNKNANVCVRLVLEEINKNKEKIL